MKKITTKGFKPKSKAGAKPKKDPKPDQLNPRGIEVGETVYYIYGGYYICSGTILREDSNRAAIISVDVRYWDKNTGRMEGGKKLNNIDFTRLYRTPDTPKRELAAEEPTLSTVKIPDGVELPMLDGEAPVNPINPFTKTKAYAEPKLIPGKKYRSLFKFKKNPTMGDLYNVGLSLKIGDTPGAVAYILTLAYTQSIATIVASLEETADLSVYCTPGIINLNKKLASIDMYRSTPPELLHIVYYITEGRLPASILKECADGTYYEMLKFELYKDNIMPPIKRLSDVYWANRKDKIYQHLTIDESFIESFSGPTSKSQVEFIIRNRLLDLLAEEIQMDLTKEYRIGGPNG